MEEILIERGLFEGPDSPSIRHLPLSNDLMGDIMKGKLKEYLADKLVDKIDDVYNNYIAGNRRMKDIEYSIEINPSMQYICSLTIESKHSYCF